MPVETKRVVTLESGEEGEITAYQINGGPVGKIESTYDISTITCDYSGCDKNVGKPTVLKLTPQMDPPIGYWKTLVLTNAKSEPKVFCSKGCLFQYLQSEFIACPIPNSNVIEMEKRGPSNVRSRA